jgi:hypothetical protein
MVGGEFRLIPERAAVVKRMFDMACSGFGLSLIIKGLTADGVQPWGGGRGWNKAYLHQIISGRAALGEYQPKSHDAPAGPPVEGYYPAVIDEVTWGRAQAAVAQRKHRIGARGRVGRGSTNLFSGILWDAATAGRLQVEAQARGLAFSRTSGLLCSRWSRPPASALPVRALLGALD